MAASGILVDAGPLVALINKRDQHHQLCLEAATLIRGPFYTAWPVVAEAAHLLKGHSELVEKLLARLRTGKLLLLPLEAADVDGISAILSRFSDQGFDLADAALMHLAEREGIENVFTIDYRHFSIYRTVHGKGLVLAPAQK